LITAAHVNLGEGALAHGSPEREIIVAILLLTVRDYLKPASREEAGAYLETREAASLCSWVGLSSLLLRERLQAIVADVDQLGEFTRRFCRRSSSEIYQALMAA
jgi:hypothetical protein